MTTSLEDYHSCSFCSDYIFDVDNSFCHSEIKPQSKEENEIFLYSNLSLSDVRKGSSANCDFCRWLLSQWTLFDPGTYRNLSEQEDKCLLYAATYSSSLLTRFPIDEIAFFGLWDGKRPESSDSPNCLIRTNAPIDILTPEGDAADEFIWNRPINTKIGSPENLARARSWLQTCLKSHPTCPKPSATFMPKRVLHISLGASHVPYGVRICVDEIPAPYVALSYCWGGDQSYKTTKARIQSGQFDLSWERLSKTVQDAIKVSFALGVEYIWVDAFCIVQDDEGDFALQMAEVPSIYTNSIVTITASRAATASQGFLHEINFNNDALLAVRLPFRCPDGKLGNAYITSIPTSRNTEPIHYRAWTYQEFYLPARLLQFGSCQLRWQCWVSKMQPGFADGWKRGYNPDDSRLEIAWTRPDTQDLFSEYAKMGMPHAERQEIAFGHWLSFIPIYTSRTIAYAGDRPWAASGMAEAWDTIIQDDYLAGHWRRSLPSSLLWHIMTSPGMSRVDGLPQLGHRLKEYLAPSWSWTSVLGPANFLYARAARNDTKLVLLDVSVELTEAKARYGAVKHGYITVQGKLREALYYGTVSEKGTEFRLERLPSKDLARNLVITKPFPDAIEPEFLASSQQANPDPIQVNLLEVGRCVASGKRGPVGLILREISRPGGAEHPVFKRLGIFHIDEKASKRRLAQFTPEEWDSRTNSELRWFDDCDLETLTIL
ncbi:heterokaryon incompatibility protein-domain-containing protein [Xylaria sp. FL0933]|nr:heterokaryon incompatibility protein-domain-containing protein [Xylaria sp. FL0933]